MESKEKEVLEIYKNWKATDYAVQVEKENTESPEAMDFVMKFFHDVSKSGRFKGSKLLEIGSAAVVHNVASLSAYFSNIVMSDYVEDNCNELKKWLEGKSSIKQFLEVTAELEGQGRDLETVKKSIEERIKANVKAVVRCDLLRDGILKEELPPHLSPPYDLITSSFAIESAAVDIKSYTQIYKRINKLLRPGGGIMMCGALRAHVYKMHNTDYHHINIGQDDVLNTLKEAGFGEIDIRFQEKKLIEFEYDRLFCVAATKVE